MHLPPHSIRALMLHAQGLLTPPVRKATKADVLKTIRRMHVLQIDTIHVVARSPYLVLWSRLGDYKPEWLDAQLAEGRIFEYWAHEACFLPIEDYPLYRHRMLDAERMGWRARASWAEKNRHHLEGVLDHIQQNGGTRSVEFVRTDGRSGNWWGWKAEKMALEHLFTTGELMIAKRHNFQRVYDLRERIVPEWHDGKLPDTADVHKQWVLNTVRALGITTATWIPDYFRIKKAEALPALRALTEAGALITTSVEGWNEPFYIHPDHLPAAKKAASGKLVPSLTTLLSPFDPIVWDRKRAKQIWDFDYKIECYTPEPKRKYGYFCLPILNNGDLIGRLDAKAHRSDGVFEVKALYLEPRVRVTDRLITELADTLKRCAAWHGTAKVKITRSEPKGLRKALGM